MQVSTSQVRAGLEGIVPDIDEAVAYGDARQISAP
jgi:hypothetical protein